ncbi:PAS domain-containing protein [ANME-2 cluster archaeon]|nr:MAG: PAS domain-containing protein [ANME-2 cluster archaeon]
MMIDAIKALRDDTGVLAEAGIEGKLDVRADASKHGGDFRKIVDGVNGLLDAVAGPINVTAEYVDRISKGDIPEKITDKYKGDFNEIKNNLNILIDALNGLINEATAMEKAAAAGELDTRADISQYNGAWANIVQGLNNTLEGVVVPLRDIGGVLDKMAAGDLKAQVVNEYQGDYNVLKVACNELGVQLTGVQKVLDDLQAAIVEGKLDTRGDASGFKGEIAGMVDGINGVIDAMVGPINVTAEYVDRISKGDIPEKITDEYRGDFNEVKNNLNVCIDAINALVDDAAMLAEAGIEGKLDARADASKHGGDFRKIVEGVNELLDAVVGPLNVAAEYVDRISRGDIPEKITDEYRGDFNEIKNNLNTMIDRVGAQISNLTSIPTPIMTIDKEFNVTYMNTVGAKLVGLTPEQCEGKKCYDLLKTPHCQTSECRCTQAMQRDEIVTGETVADPNGLNMPIQYTGAPIKDRDGNMIGALEYVVDITKTKEAMDDASEKVEYLNNVPTPVMVIDKEMNVRFMNPAGAAAVGRAPEACVGQKCFSLFNTEHCNTAECRTAKAMQENGTFTGDTVAKLPSGDLPIRYTGAPIKDAAGNVIGGLEYVTDISEEAQTVAEVGDLVEAALAGNLDARGNPDNYSIIGFKNIVQGLNDTLDAVVGPINEVVRIVNAYSEGKLDARVEIDAQGEFKALGETLDQFGEDLQAIITEVARLAGMAADGDLTVEAEVEAKGEFNDLVNSVNALTGVLSDTVVSARGVGGKVLGTAQQLASAAEEMNTGMEQLASASQQVAEGSQKLAELAQETARNIEDVAAQIDQTSVNASKSAEKGQNAVQISHEVQEAAQKTLEGLAAIQEGITKTSTTVSEMNTAIEKVGEMGNVITDVAGQTNMLGLNAAIEAARAGEAGRGFAVVADAVKNLAEKVKDAAGESGVAISHIQESGKNAIGVSKTAVEEATRGGELMHTALEGVDKVTGAIDEVSAMVQEIDSGAKHVAEVIKKVVAGMDEVASVSEESASASEESSSAVQQQTSVIQELTSETQGLADIAQELMDELNRFTVREAEA